MQGGANQRSNKKVQAVLAHMTSKLSQTALMTIATNTVLQYSVQTAQWWRPLNTPEAH